MGEVILFLSSMVLVTLFGMQSQIVRLGHKMNAFFTSVGIGIMQTFAFKMVPDSTPTEAFAYIMGGACGIVLSILLHEIYVKKLKINDTRGVTKG